MIFDEKSVQQVFPFGEMGAVLHDKLGEEVSFLFAEDIYNDQNKTRSGFTTDLVVAYLGDREVAYMKIGYIKRETFQEMYGQYPKNIRIYAAANGISYLHDRDGNLKTGEQLADVLENYIRRDEYYMKYKARAGFDLGHDDIIALADKALGKNKTVRTFKDLFVDVPKVDYIQTHTVYWPDLVQRGSPFRRTGDELKTQEGYADKDYRGRGISTLLYVIAAKWMATKGLALHSSTLQSPEAKMAWEALRKREDIQVSVNKTGRLVLNVPEDYEPYPIPNARPSL